MVPDHGFARVGPVGTLQVQAIMPPLILCSSELKISAKITKLTRNSLKKSFSPGDLEGATSLKHSKKINASEGVISITSC